MNKKIEIAIGVVLLIASIICIFLLVKGDDGDNEIVTVIELDSEEAKECLKEFEKYANKHMTNREDAIMITKIEKHEQGVDKDSFAIRRDSETAEADHYVYYKLTCKGLTSIEVYRYTPKEYAADPKELITRDGMSMDELDAELDSYDYDFLEE